LLLVLFLFFTLIPLAEIYLLIQVGQVIGTWDTVGLVVVSGIIGAYAAKTQGKRVIGQIEEQLRSGGEPSSIFLQALLVFVGGIFMIAPGFITDILGMSFILPFTRNLYVGTLKKLFKKGVSIGKIHVYTGNSSDGFYGSPQEPTPRPKRTLEKDADVIDISTYRNKN